MLDNKLHLYLALPGSSSVLLQVRINMKNKRINVFLLVVGVGDILHIATLNIFLLTAVVSDTVEMITYV